MARLVKAIAEGFHGGMRRREGSVFSIGDTEKLGKWMVELQPTKAPASEKQAPEEARTTAASLGDKAIADMKYNELLARAKALGLAFPQNPNKDALVAAIIDAEKALDISLV